MQLEPWHWFIFGITLIILEMFVPSFFLLWFGVAAVVVAGINFIVPLEFLTAVIIWLIGAIACCVGWFKFVQPHIKNRTKAGFGASTIIGETGMIIQAPSANGAGIIRFNTPKAGASEWMCRSQDGLPLMVGERAVIVDILGNELLVSKK